MAMDEQMGRSLTPETLREPEDEGKKLAFAGFMADELVNAHRVLDRLGAPKTKEVPTRWDYLRKQDITLGIADRLAAIESRAGYHGTSSLSAAPSYSPAPTRSTRERIIQATNTRKWALSVAISVNGDTAIVAAREALLIAKERLAQAAELATHPQSGMSLPFVWLERVAVELNQLLADLSAPSDDGKVSE